MNTMNNKPWSSDQLSKVIERIKGRLPEADDESIPLIEDYAVEVGWRILHYCNIKRMPFPLQATWAAMTLDMLRAQAGNNAGLFGESAIAADCVKSITEGDISISFGLGAKASEIAGGGTPVGVFAAIVSNYAHDLHRYRKMRI